MFSDKNNIFNFQKLINKNIRIQFFIRVNMYIILYPYNFHILFDKITISIIYNILLKYFLI